MKRAKKRGSRSVTVVDPGSSLVIGGVTPGSTRRPPDSSRAGASRLATASSEVNKEAKARAPTSSAADTRGEKEGRKPQKAVAAATLSPKQPAKKPSAPKGERPDAMTSPPARDRRRRADARAKGAQIRQAGLESRLLGHVSGSVKRNQARRDSKNG